MSHVDDLPLADPDRALFAGLATLPKKPALTEYSYRTSYDDQRAFLAAGYHDDQRWRFDSVRHDQARIPKGHPS